ncbi:ABC transporter ATP-binding protein [Rugosimonospora acidiphila]|uniref:ABC transporter ATP-binding protein n=1 Tax=Rugosimonospora acidiphila TaxID=556531 RepID=A0ABP9RXK8_9ACTN
MRDRLRGLGERARGSSRLAVLRLLPDAGRGSVAGLAAAIVISGLAPAAAVLVSGRLATELVAAARGGLGSPAGHRAVLAAVELAALFLAGQLGSRLSAALATSLGARVDGSLQRRAIRAVNGPSGVAHLDDPSVRDLLSRVAGVGAGGYTPGGAVAGLATRAGQSLTSGVGIVVVGFFHWWLAVALLAVNVWWGRESRRGYLAQTQVVARQTALMRRAGYLRDLVLTPGPAKEVRLFGLTGWLGDRFRAEWDSAMEKVWAARHGRRRAFAAALGGVVAVNFAAYALLAGAALRHAIGLGALVVFLRAVTLAASLNARGQQDFQIEYGLSGLPAVTAVERAARAAVAREKAVPEPVDGDRAGEGPPAGDGLELVLRGVRFGYPGADRPVLDGLDLTVPAGRSLAIVGVNGAGKTTLIKLLCRFYDPDAGTITAGGIDLRALDPYRWQRGIAAVFQDFARYELPARDNIGFGALRLAGDGAAIEDAAARAGILDALRALPRGWDSPLARHFDGGGELSGGQWQRVALARALLAVDAGARLLILDEPTANLDIRAEAAFYDQFLDITRAVTTILISHRFATVRRADLICVLDGGQVAELGSHADLLGRGGRYAEMFAAQSAQSAPAAS